METNQIQFLKNLAKKLRKEKKTKEQSLASLQAAGILTKKGRFTKPYKNLSKLFPNIK